MPPKLLQSLTPTVLPHQQTPRKGDEQAIRWQTPAGNKGTFVIKALSAAGLSAGVLDNGSHFCTVVLTGAGVKEEHRTGAVKHSLSPTFIAEPMAWSVHHRASTVTFTVWCTNDKKELSVGEFALPLSGLEDGAGVLDEALVSTGKCRPSVNATGRILCMYDYVRPPVNALLPITPDAVREGTFGKLHMRILKCEGLLATSGSSNPFVRVTCCGRYTKFLETSKQYRTINPYFDEWLGFDIQERHFNVRVEVCVVLSTCPFLAAPAPQYVQVLGGGGISGLWGGRGMRGLLGEGVGVGTEDGGFVPKITHVCPSGWLVCRTTVRTCQNHNSRLLHAPPVTPMIRCCQACLCGWT